METFIEVKNFNDERRFINTKNIISCNEANGRIIIYVKYNQEVVSLEVQDKYEDIKFKLGGTEVKDIEFYGVNSLSAKCSIVEVKDLLKNQYFIYDGRIYNTDQNLEIFKLHEGYKTYYRIFYNLRGKEIGFFVYGNTEVQVLNEEAIGF